jgi:hypothetical protein
MRAAADTSQSSNPTTVKHVNSSWSRADVIGPLSNNVVRFSPNPVLSGPPSVLNQRGPEMVPSNFLDREVPISVESDTYESTKPDEKYRLSGSSLYVSVLKRAGRISGRVQDENGNPLSGVKIQVADFSTTTNSVGHFEFTIPGDRMQKELDLGAVASGYSSIHLKVVPNGNDVVIPLSRAR